MLSLVDQRENEYLKDNDILYTLALIDFRPEEPEFQKFIESNHNYLVLTERTKIYARTQSTNTKISMPISELHKVIKPAGAGDYPEIEFWVTPYKKVDSYVEAIEVILIH